MMRQFLNRWTLALSLTTLLFVAGCSHGPATVDSTKETRPVSQNKGAKKQGLTAENPG